MSRKTVIMRTLFGLHLRPAAEIVRLSRKYRAEVILNCPGDCENCRHADTCSIIQLLLLQAKSGDKVTITADGPDENEVIDEICRVLTAEGDET
ncbi:MAG: HPr family phosphocarrier protein [Candidatus Auribacterota bacterium]|nr:HPr family phosphocarrier protein [Candidatus Auribacterota bacterium]